MKKNNLTMKYSVGLLIITLITLLAERILVSLFRIIDYDIFRVIMVLVPFAISLIGLYLLQKIILKKEKSDIDVSKLLTKIFIISLIYMLLSALYIVCRFHILINIKNEILTLETLDIITPDLIEKIGEKIGEKVIELVLIKNAEYVMNAIIGATIYISFLMFTFVRHWINNIVQGKDNERKNGVKKYKVLIILVITSLIIESVLAFGIKKSEDNFEVQIVVKTERELTSYEKNRVESQLSQIEEIISYEYKSSDDAFNRLKELYKNSSIFEGRDSNFFPASYEITVRAKDRDVVNQKLKMIEGIE